LEEDLDGLFFAFTVANLAGRILAEACGSEAQAVVLAAGSTRWSGSVLAP
jgi:hypothetical protein